MVMQHEIGIVGVMTDWPVNCHIHCYNNIETWWVAVSYQLVASWCSPADNACWVLDLGFLLLNSPFLPLGLSHITTPGIFLYLLMVFAGSGRIVHALVSSCILCLLAFSAGLKLVLELLLLLLLFTIIYLKQTMFLGYTVLQLFCSYNLWYM